MTFRIDELFKVSGKIAVVTGGSRGIGRMIASAFVENGMRVYITSRKAAELDATAAELAQAGPGECIPLPADLASDEGRRSFVEALTARETHLDVLVNNAGAAWGAPFEDYPESGYDKVMDINVRAVFLLTRDLVPLLREGADTDNPSRVINIGSMDGIKVSFQDNYAYGASKAAIHFLTQNLAVRLAGQGITFNAIAPGAFQSKMMEWTLDNHQGSIEAANPLGRIGRPPDMAGIALYLASPAASYVNGAVIPVDGGSSLGATPET